MSFLKTNHHKKTSKDFFVIVFVVLIDLCFTLSYTSNIGFFSYLGMAFLLFAMAILNPTDGFCLFIGLIPNIRIIKFLDFENAVLSFSFIILELKFFVININKTKLFAPSLLLTVSIVITMVINVDLGFVSPLLRFILLITFIFNYFRIFGIEKGIANRLIWFFIFGVINNVFDGFIYYLLSHQRIIGSRFIGVSIDSNYYAVVISLAIAVLCLDIGTKNNAFGKMVLIAFFVFAGFLSGSRTFLISLIPISLYACYHLLFSKKGRKYLFLIAIFVAFVIVAWDKIYPFLELAIKRMDSESTSGGNGRFDAWAFYLNEWLSSFSSLLFGNGKNLTLFFNGKNTVIQHNLFLECLSEIGIIGSTFYLICFFKLHRLIIQKKIVKLKFFMPLLVLLICYCSLNALFSETSTILFVVCFLSMSRLSVERKKNYIKRNEKVYAW